MAILIVAVVLKILFPVSAYTLDFSSHQKEQRLSERNVSEHFRAFLGLIRVRKTNLKSGNRTVLLFLGEYSDHFWLGGGFNVKLILTCKRGAHMHRT